MRLLFLYDKKINREQLDELERQFSDLVYETAGLTPEYFHMEWDYTSVQTEPDKDGDDKPTTAYLKDLTDKVHKIYGTYGVDSIVLLVHRSNWKFNGYWGTNLSNVYYQYHLHMCRFDHTNAANSLGTLYHEWMHSLDALILTHTGVEIDNYFKNTQCFVDWDSTCVHGNRFTGCKQTPYKYIKWKDNLDALQMISPDLKKAYAVRKQLYLKPLINVQLSFISFLRGLLAKKKGVPRGT